MDLQSIYFVGEIIAAIAVVLSLLFVGFQMRQNTRAMRQQVTQNMVEMWAASNRDLLINENLLADATEAFMGNRSAAAQADLRFTMWISNALRQVEFAYFNWRSGELTEDYWRQTEVTLPQIMQSARGRRAWLALRARHAPAFRSLMDGYLPAELRPADPPA